MNQLISEFPQFSCKREKKKVDLRTCFYAFYSNTDLPAAHEPRFCSQVSFFINWYETVLQKRRAVRTNPTRLDSLIGVYCYMVKFKALQISREHESQYLDEN